MADEPDKDQPNDGIEDEIKGLIAEAESLSADLATEVGATDAPPAPRESEFFESETDSEASLDMQIAQADAALEQATNELGRVEEIPAPKKKITLPPKQKEASAPAEPSEAPGPQTAVLSDTAPSADADDVPPIPAQELIAAYAAEATSEANRSAGGRWTALRSRLPLEKLARLAQGACYVLELFDRPFHRVSYRVRSIIGWLALAFAVAAASLFFFVVL